MQSRLRVRTMSPLGRYPNKTISVGKNRLLVRDDIVITTVPIVEPKYHGFMPEDYSEVEFLSLEEIRLLASFALALRPDAGMAYAYPLPFHFDIDRDETSEDSLFQQAVAHSLAEGNRWVARGAVLPPAVGGPKYQLFATPLDEDLTSRLLQHISIQDRMLIRGLGAQIKADMLWQHHEFREAAIMMLHVAMEASFQIVLRTLSKNKISNPSAEDAGEFIGQVFNPGVVPGKYFSDYYEDRIKSLHPLSRFGEFAFPPLQADDYYDLRTDLSAVYAFLIAGHIWSDI